MALVESDVEVRQGFMAWQGWESVLRTVGGEGAHAADGHDAHQPAVLVRHEVYSRIILQHTPQQSFSMAARPWGGRCSCAAFRSPMWLMDDSGQETRCCASHREVDGRGVVGLRPCLWRNLRHGHQGMMQAFPAGQDACRCGAASPKLCTPARCTRTSHSGRRLPWPSDYRLG